MKRSTLLGHLFVWGTLLLLALGLLTWEVSINLDIRECSYDDAPKTLSWQMGNISNDLVANIKKLRVYYKTYGDKSFSESKVQDVSFRAFPSESIYATDLPPHLTAFRLDVCFKDKHDVQLPEIARIRLGDTSIKLKHLKPWVDQKRHFASWRYDIPMPLNGWGSRLIPAAILVWFLCMTGLYFLLRKSLSRQ